MLIKFVLPLLKKTGTTIRVLVDSWYMKAPFILPLRDLDLNLIGQVRKDTALFEPPVQIDKKREDDLVNMAVTGHLSALQNCLSKRKR